MKFAPVVEQWRSTVAQYVPAQYVDKVLWVINYESGGDPHAVGDGGRSIGLLQIQNNLAFPGRPTTEQLLDPAFNIQFAATQLGINQGNFAAWGENNLFNGQPFGALGNHPFPADPNAGDTVVGGIDVNNIPVIGDAVGGVVGGVANAGDALLKIGGAFVSIGKAFAWLLDPHHWFRIFFIAAGVGLVIVGGHMYARGNEATGDYRKIAEMGAMAA